MSLILSSNVRIVPIKGNHENRGLFASWKGNPPEPYYILKEVRTLDGEHVAYLGVLPFKLAKVNGIESFFAVDSEDEYIIPVNDVVRPDAVIDLYADFDPNTPRLLSISVGSVETTKLKHELLNNFVQALRDKDSDAFELAYLGSFGAVLRGKGDYEGFLAYDTNPYPTEYNASLHVFGV